MRSIAFALLCGSVGAIGHVGSVEKHIVDENCKVNYIRHSKPACLSESGCHPHGTDELNGCQSITQWQWPKHATGVNPHPRQRVTANGDDKKKTVWAYVGDPTQGEAEQIYGTSTPTVEYLLNTPVNQISFIANTLIMEPTAWFVPGKNNTNGCGQLQTWNLPFGFKADKNGVVNETALVEFKANLQKLHQAGTTITLTMGSWCTQFPILPTEKWTDTEFNQFVDYFKTLRDQTFGGALDGIDFDWEGFCNAVCLKGECVCDWSHSECGMLSPDELAAGHSYEVTDRNGKTHKKMCWMMPTETTMQVMAGITHYMKKAGFVVTLVPMSTSMYSGEEDATKEQNMRNEYVKFRKQTIDGQQVDLLEMADAILLQWYSGFDASLCQLTNDPKHCQCDNKPDADYANTITLDDGLISSYWSTQPEIGGNMFPQSYPVRCQACGKNVTLPNGTWGELACAPEDDQWYEATESRSLSGDSDKTEDHKAKLQNYTETKKTIPYWWVKGLEVNSKCPRRIDCPDWRYEGEEDYASQVKLLQSISKVVDLSKVCTGYESLGIDVQVQMQAYADPALPWTTATKAEIFTEGVYYHPCQTNMTTGNVNDEKRCAQPLLSQQWGLKFKAEDVLGLEAATLKATGKELAGVGFFTLDGLLWSPNGDGWSKRFWYEELSKLNQTYQLPCHGTCCSGVGAGCADRPAPAKPKTTTWKCDWSAPWPQPPKCVDHGDGWATEQGCEATCNRAEILV